MAIEENPEIHHDLELEGVQIDGMSVGQIRRLKAYYQAMSGDLDLLELTRRTEKLL